MNHTGVQSTGWRRVAASSRSAGVIAGCFLSWLLTGPATLLCSRPLPPGRPKGNPGRRIQGYEKALGWATRAPARPAASGGGAGDDPDAAVASPLPRALGEQLA